MQSVKMDVVGGIKKRIQTGLVMLGLLVLAGSFAEADVRGDVIAMSLAEDLQLPPDGRPLEVRECRYAQVYALQYDCIKDVSIFNEIVGMGMAPICEKDQLIEFRQCESFSTIEDILFSNARPLARYHSPHHILYDTIGRYCIDAPSRVDCEISRRFANEMGCIDDVIEKNLKQVNSRPICDLVDGFRASCRCQ